MNRNDDDRHNDQAIDYKAALYGIALVTFSLLSGWMYWVTSSILSSTEARLGTANDFYKWQAEVDASLAGLKNNSSDNSSRLAYVENEVRNLRFYLPKSP